MDTLRQNIQTEEFDYQLLLSHLQEYKKPRNKITQLLRSGSIIRIKKGLYIFGEKYRRNPICAEALANLIYGPSYISKEYALSYYNLIPERVSVITSMTTKKNKIFETPLGHYSYQHLRLERYHIGVHYLPFDQFHSVLIASPEKALADLLLTRKDLQTPNEMREHLLNNLRIEKEDIAQLKFELLYEIAEYYRTPSSKALLTTVKELSL